MCRDHHQHPELFQDIYRILDGKYRPCPSMVCVIIGHFIAFPPTQTCSCFALYLKFLATQHCSSLTWNITTFYVINVMRISPPLKNSWYGETSHHHHSFLVLVLIPTGVPTSERCCLSYGLLATLLL